MVARIYVDQRNETSIEYRQETETQIIVVVVRSRVPSCIAGCGWMVGHIVRYGTTDRHSVVGELGVAVFAATVAVRVTETGTGRRYSDNRLDG